MGVKMKFKDAPIGARFIFPNTETIWVKINSFPKDSHGNGYGLICQWLGNVKQFQPCCSFVDGRLGTDYDTEIELI